MNFRYLTIFRKGRLGINNWSPSLTSSLRPSPRLRLRSTSESLLPQQFVQNFFHPFISPIFWRSSSILFSLSFLFSFPHLSFITSLILPFLPLFLLSLMWLNAFLCVSRAFHLFLWFFSATPHHHCVFVFLLFFSSNFTTLSATMNRIR